MDAPPLLLAVLLAAAAPPAAPPEHGPENLLAGPARCVLRYLDAVRLAGPRVSALRNGRLPPSDERAYAAARRLTATRTLEEIDRRAAQGEGHPLAPWRDAARARVLESFQLVAARRAPLGAAVISVRERYWLGDPGGAIEQASAEYLVARVDGEWKVVDRRPGGTFDDATVAGQYAGFFDAARPSR